MGVLCVLSLAWQLAVTVFRRHRRAYHFLELSLRRRRVPADRAPLVAGVAVIGFVVAVVAAVCGVGLYWWRKLTNRGA